MTALRLRLAGCAVAFVVAGTTCTKEPTTGAVKSPVVLVDISVENGHACAVAADGDAYCWGDNETGALGNGSTASLESTPVVVSGGTRFATVSAGGAHSCGLTNLGVAYCWGAGGVLGSGSSIDLQQCNHTDCSPTPVAVAGGLTFATVSARGAHTCGVTTGGAGYCWGTSYYGELGGLAGTALAPVPIAGGLQFATVSAGMLSTCGVTRGGAAYCWGLNDAGQLGVGSVTGPQWCGRLDGPVWPRDTVPCSWVPVAVVGELSFASVSAGGRHTCGITTSGEAYCWGDNFWGQLGTGNRTSSSTPVAVSGGLSFASVSAGYSYTCGVTTRGAAYCWGGNFSGQLGNGSTADSNVPVAVSGEITWKAVTSSSGSLNTCGLTTGGAVYCWGDNSFGQLGNGSFTSSSTPVLITP